MLFYVITKNLNWEILTMNLVTFKRLGSYIRGKLPEKGGLNSSQI